MFDILAQLGDNFAALVSLIFVFSIFSKATLKRKGFFFSVVIGLLFSAAALFGMLHPIKITEGVIVDARVVLVALAGTFGGPVSALIAVLSVAGYRIYIGGVGSFAGVTVIILAGIIGVFFAWEKINHDKSFYRYGLEGLVLAAVALAATLLLPQSIAIPALERLFFPVLVFYPAATILYGTIFGFEIKKQNTIDRLEDSEARFRLLADSSTDMISRHTPAGSYLYVSPACRVILGYEPEELIGHSAFEFVHPDDIPKVDQSRSSIIDQPITSTTVFRARCKNGEYIWLETTSKTILDKNTGAVLEIHAASRNVTERKQAEKARKESDERFSLLFQNLNSNFILHEIILDDEGQACDYRFLAINPAAEKAIGLNAADVIGKTARELFPGTEQYWIEKFGEVALSGVPVQYENYTAELNKYFDMRIYSPQKGQFALLGLDVTERRLADEARRESEARYRLIAENTADVIWVLDVETRSFKYVSPSVIKLRGYTPEEVIAQPVSAALTPQSAKQVEESLAYWIPRFLADPSNPLSLTSEVEQPCKNGSIVHTEVTTTYVLTEQGKLEIVGVSRDITERKMIENTLYFLAERGWAEHGGDFFSAMARYLGETLAIDYVFIDRVDQDGKNARTLANYWRGEICPNFEYELINTPCENIYGKKMCTYAAHIQQKFPLDFILFDISAESYSGVPLWDSKGNAVGLIALLHREPIQNVQRVEALLQLVAAHVGHEIERVEAEMALRNERDRAQNYLDTVEALIVVLDAQGKISLINRKGCRLLGYTDDELLGKLWFEICLPQPQGLAVEYPTFIELLSGKERASEYYENPVITRAGDLRQIAWHNTILRNPQGQITGTLSAGEDITDRKQAEYRIQNQLERLNVLHNIDNVIKSSTELRTTLKIILDEIAPQLKVDAASILLLNRNTFTLDHIASRGFHSDVLQNVKLRAGEGHAGRIILEGKTIYFPDIKEADGSLTGALIRAGENFTSYVGAPLSVKGQIVGVLEIFQHAPLAPDPEWFNFVEILAGQAAIAIDSAQMFTNLQQANFNLTMAYDATIEGWSHAMDLRDKETEGHTKRVTTLTVQLAQQMGIPDAEIVHIRRGALLHDMGKMGVPDQILHKQGKLTPQEWDIMRQHPVFAYEMLRPISYLKPALDIPYCHHEKWDGTGYPQSLKGEQIPLAARLFSVVDVWDALSYDRPYRSAWPREKVIEHIREQAGLYFDPHVVEIFLRLQAESAL